MDTKATKERLQKHVDDARSIVRKAEDQGRPLTQSERDVVELHIRSAAEFKEVLRDQSNADVDNALRTLSGGGGGSDLYRAAKVLGWPEKKVAVAAEHAFKTITFDTGDFAEMDMPRFSAAALGYDHRKRLFDVFPATAVPASTTSVQVFRQSSRTLASSDYGWVHRALDSAGNKIETTSAVELVQAAMEMVASVETGLPNIYLLQDGVRDVINTDLRLSYERGLEDMAIDALYAAGASTGSAGSDLMSSVVYAASDMAANGYNPSVVVINPLDFNVYLLLKGQAEVPARQDPLAGFTFVVNSTLATREGFVLDPQAAGRLYVSGVTLATFEENAGRTNTSTIRLEGTALLNIQRSGAIIKLADTS